MGLAEEAVNNKGFSTAQLCKQLELNAARAVVELGCFEGVLWLHSYCSPHARQ
jgi:hypothetical protein